MTPVRRPRRPAGRRDFPVQTDLSGALDGGTTDIEGLKDEMEEWASNLESNNMEHLPKYEEVNEAKDQLETAVDTLQGLEVPEHLEDLDARYTIDTRTSAQSRSGRLDNAMNALNAAKDAAQAWLDEHEALEATDTEDPDELADLEAKDEVVTQEMADEDAAQVEATEQFVNDLESAIGDAEGVSFPGMY
jgi:chromosome segregation ATPase